MRITLLAFTILTICPCFCSAQKVKKIRNINERANTTEIFYVLKEKKDIKHGEYLYKYNGKIQVQGQFEQNYAVGKWIYTPGKDFRIEGNFLNNRKNGVWKYYSNDRLISEIRFKEGVLDGKATGYYENGQVAANTAYADGHLEGEYIAFHENGNIKEKSNYTEGKLDGLFEKFDKNGEPVYSIKYNEGVPFNLDIMQNNDSIYVSGNLQNGTGEFIEYDKNNDGDKYVASIKTFENGKLNGSVEGFDPKGKPFYRGQYKNGYKIGMWEFYMNNNQKHYKSVYQYSDSIKEDSTDRFLNVYRSGLKLYGTMPKFENSNSDQFRYHIMRTLIYPIQAQRRGISGRVYVQFKISEQGLVKDAEVVRGVDKYLDREALRVVKSSPLWIPGFKDQLPVDVLFTFPIVFQLR
ncbi:MAG: TonB family protein [Bacteroidetes bacterium]|nr:TonB family protein [Bacteroidota bacterium]